jgi:hypothetical protein
MKVSIIVPTLSRPTQLRRNMERLLETVRGLDTEIIIVAEVNRSSVDAMAGLPVKVLFREEWRGSVAGWNRGAAAATGDLLVTGADDLWWHDGWLEAALGAMQQAGTCYVGLNDCIHSGNTGIVTHWAITRQGVIDHTGGCLHIPAYRTAWTDIEIKERMLRASQFQWCAKAMVEHRHHITGAAYVDKCYLIQKQHMAGDEDTFRQRQAAGFPNDFAPVIMRGDADWRTAPGYSVTMPERELLVMLAGQVGGGVIVNIGMGPGATMRCLRAGAPEADLTGVEIDPLWAVAGPWQTLLGDSKTMTFDKPIDLLFVDGDHTEDGVRGDIATWAGRVKPGGVMAFHDYGNSNLPWCSGVKTAVDALVDWPHGGDAGSIRWFRRMA